MPTKTKTSCEIVRADCAEFLPALFRAGRAIDLCVGDPPYNYGVDYDAYDDNKPLADYLSWTRNWLALVGASLARRGSIWVFYPDELITEVDHIARHDLGLYRQNWVIWAFGFGVACQGKFSRAHTHILHYTKRKKGFTFNADAVRVPSDRQLLYNDKRANPKGKLPNNVWVLQRAEMEATLPAASDVWYQSRVCGTFHARQAVSPNQIPVPLLERIVLACSNPGDLVVDPFGGTFSTAEAALRHGRSFAGCDVSAKCVGLAKKRLLGA